MKATESNDSQDAANMARTTINTIDFTHQRTDTRVGAETGVDHDCNEYGKSELGRVTEGGTVIAVTASCCLPAKEGCAKLTPSFIITSLIIQ